MRLVSKYGWEIVPKQNGFLYYEMNCRGDKIGCFRLRQRRYKFVLYCWN